LDDLSFAMRILVTGVTGFAGGHLAEALLAHGEHRVVGVARRAVWPAPWGQLAGRVELHECDVCAREVLEKILHAVQPERVYHLAGYPHVGRSFQEPEAAWQGNLTATRTLYDAVSRWGGRPRILFVGSGLVYGDSIASQQGCTENDLLFPDNPYAASKAAADLVSYQCTRSPKLDIVRVRPFTHIGPRQSPQFAVSSFARQLATIERGRQAPVLETGNLRPRRDLTDVRDVVAAYMLLMEHGRIGEVYNVASGEVYSIETVLERLISLSGVQVQVRQKVDLLRETDAANVRADAGKLRRATGWSPRFTLDRTLMDLLAYWRGQS
jgi:GDP-4-dehydro-6-deoxy-D-mannose reductase